MKMRMKLALLVISAGTVAAMLTSCARFLGDFVGDRWWMSVID